MLNGARHQKAASTPSYICRTDSLLLVLFLLRRQPGLLGAAGVGAQHELVVRVLLVHGPQLDLVQLALEARAALLQLSTQRAGQCDGQACMNSASQVSSCDCVRRAGASPLRHHYMHHKEVCQKSLYL